VTASEVVEDPRLMSAAEFFFDQVSRRRSFAFGGNAFDEEFEAPGVESTQYDDLTGETCNTHNLLQFSRALFARTGEAMPESGVVANQTAYHKLPPVQVPALKSVSSDALQPVSGRPLTYTAPTADGRQVVLMPFYQLHHQRYSLYWRADP
jgi:hypothetical protein